MVLTLCRTLLYLVCLVAAIWSAPLTDSLLFSNEIRRMPAGARICALGDAGVALAGSGQAIYYNPASVALIDSYDVGIEGAVLYGGLSRMASFYIAVPVPPDLGLGITATPFFSGPIDRYDSLPGTFDERLNSLSMRANGSMVGEFTNNHLAATISCGRKFNFALPRPQGVGSYPLSCVASVGGAFSLAGQRFLIDDVIRMGMNVNCDIGAIARVDLDYSISQQKVVRDLTIGIALKDILPTKTVWFESPGNYAEPVYLNDSYGVTYHDISGLLKSSSMTVLLGIARTVQDNVDGTSKNATVYRQASLQTGLEFEYFHMVSVRLGLSRTTPVFGAGVRYKKWYLDYAFRFDQVDFSPVRLTAGMIF